MGLMYRVIRKYREHVGCPSMHKQARNKSDVISTENFLNVYFDR